MKLSLLSLLILLYIPIHAQKTSIDFELNGRISNEAIEDSVELSKNRFSKFIGEWKLKDDRWIQNWGGGTDTILIPNHHTISSQINTENTLLSIIDGPEPNGHILWSYNPVKGEITHLSSFGVYREGIGKGMIIGQQNLMFRVHFEGEDETTYRIYTYDWINDDEYVLNSVQYDYRDEPTGLFYTGNFIRLKTIDSTEIEIQGILKILDNNEISKEEQLEVYADDIIHMAPNHKIIDNKNDLLAYLKEQEKFGRSDMTHKMIEFSEHGDIIVVRGSVEGVWVPADGGEGRPFETKNLILFSRENGQLKIKKVIYNMTPVD